MNRLLVTAQQHISWQLPISPGGPGWLHIWVIIGIRINSYHIWWYSPMSHWFILHMVMSHLMYMALWLHIGISHFVTVTFHNSKVVEPCLCCYPHGRPHWYPMTTFSAHWTTSLLRVGRYNGFSPMMSRLLTTLMIIPKYQQDPIFWIEESTFFLPLTISPSVFYWIQTTIISWQLMTSSTQIIRFVISYVSQWLQRNIPLVIDYRFWTVPTVWAWSN